MKKFAIGCLVVVAAAMFVPAANAGTLCYHLTNFCDGVQITTHFVGGVTGTEAVGLWDWLCLANGTGSLDSGAKTKFGTQPLYPYSGGTGSGFNANFTFKVVNFVPLFDLYGTVDGINTFAFQTNQPWTKTSGPCSPLAGQKNLPKATVQQ